ncbi:MAG TPA: FtsW/RodA/SpoVE family cell cycle protein, partial [Thermoanaerobaculia bacterium]|nr:FtsW/RodA/SpoVE family cell cycle protein [Thermoanaerobaculia bacterium]
WTAAAKPPLSKAAGLLPQSINIPIAASLFTVVRLLLLLGGFKESINLGARLSLSVLHIPAAVILQGYFLWRAWQRVRANGQLTRRDHLDALSIFVFVWCIPAALTSDIGLALLNVPLFALLYLGLARRSQKGRVLSYALAAVVALFIAGAPLLRLALPFIRNEEFLLGFASDSNYARFLHFAAPERLQALATKRGESLAITSAILQSYISSGIFGRGYGHSDVSPHLGDTALRDFAPAVFVAAEWGLIGTLAMLLIYLLFTVAAHPWLPWHNGTAAESVIAFVAAATITVSSAYMILANHELLLLTGKNAYLIGLDSAGDVIETLALLLIIAYGARREIGSAFGGGSA